MKNYLLAIAVLMGTIIGVGMFAMPYVIMKSGLILFLIYMPILAIIQYYLHLLFAEVVLSTKGDKRLPGYAARYGGKTAKYITLILSLLSDYGVLLAYIIFGGIFLHQLLNPVFGGSLFVYATALFLLESVIVLFGLKAIANFEFLLTAFMVFVIGLIIWRGQDLISFNNYNLYDWQYWFYPYGPFFFSVAGQAAIPEVCHLLKDQKHKLKSAIAWGTFLSAVVMSLFALAVAGITGAGTTTDALAGLNLVYGNGFVKLGLIFGLLAVITSMVTIAQACREIFWWDFNINKYVAWALACLAPYALYFFGLRNLTQTISLTGAFSGGALGLVVILLVLRIKKKCDRQSIIVNNINRNIAYTLSFLFILGIAYEVWAVFQK